jgi:hypothetical protein
VRICLKFDKIREKSLKLLKIIDFVMNCLRNIFISKENNLFIFVMNGQEIFKIIENNWFRLEKETNFFEIVEIMSSCDA